MDDFTKAYLAKLVDKDPKKINEEEMAFLKARAYYLTSDQKERFGIKKEVKPKAEKK